MLNKLILNSIVFKDDLDQGRSQSQLISKVIKLGIRNFEIRREFLTKGIAELQAIKKHADAHHIQLFYSINEDLIVDNQINPLLSEFIKEAVLLQAPFIKLNIGDASKISLQQLQSLKVTPIGIRVENNQTLGHANIANCQHFMALCQQAKLPISFVFDTANWVFVNDTIAEAVAALSSVTTYLHCKNYHIVNQHPQVTSSLFEGHIDIPQLLAQFDNIEYYALEYPSNMATLNMDIERMQRYIVELK